MLRSIQPSTAAGKLDAVVAVMLGDPENNQAVLLCVPAGQTIPAGQKDFITQAVYGYAARRPLHDHLDPPTAELVAPVSGLLAGF